MNRGRAPKAPDALRTIGEVAAETGIAPHILRYWEQTVPALRPLRRAGGRRYFRAEDVAIVRRLDDLLNRQGYTLEGAARALRSRGDSSVVSVSGAGQPVPAESTMPSVAPSAPPSALGNDALLGEKWQRIRARLQSALDSDFA